MWNSNQLNTESEGSLRPLIVPFAVVRSTLLPLVGGKAANLGELIHAGFQVPDGFCVTTAAYELVSSSAQLKPILDAIAAVKATDVDQLSRLAAEVHAELTAADVPARIVEPLREAYRDLATHESLAVAVRSSATAEDLPFASFAGQQETYLNIIGFEHLLKAVRDCWASLWTHRAVTYRASQGIDPRSVRLAVIVQQMVDARTAGILFTANPLTGRRQEAVINASFGLGEAVVSGAVNPDHFVIDMPAGKIIERRLGDKRVAVEALRSGGTQRVERANVSEQRSLTDEQIVALARLGMQVEAHFGAPQDIEWAIDPEGQIWLTQARPITTLFPLPAEAPSGSDVLRVYLSLNVQQGSHQPFTPMGISGVRLLVSSILTFAGLPVSDPLAGPGFVTETASRVFLDVTGGLRNSFGRTVLVQMIGQAEAHAATIFAQLVTDPRLSLRSARTGPFVRVLGRVMFRTGVLWHLLRTLLAPRIGHERLLRFEERLREAGKIEPATPISAHLAAAEHLFYEAIPDLLSATFPIMLGGMLTLGLARKLLGDLAAASEIRIIQRGLPSNPTTEMNLALWSLAQQVQADPLAADATRDNPPEQLAADYLQGRLPARLQQGLAAFLALYGHRSVNELDLGLPRWAEDPTYLFGILASYIELHDPAHTPDALYRRAVQDAEEMAAELIQRASAQSWLRGRLVRFFLKRARALGGLREMPRSYIALLQAQMRPLLRRVGEALAQAGTLEAADDIFFVSLAEASTALSGSDLRAVVRSRRSLYAQELTRRHVPIVLLSDGTEPSASPGEIEASPGVLRGIPVSPGTITAPARVILEPHGARLVQGEILIAPSTDPGWTPLFLLAGGLVMETGGEVSHGAIVAREYGIPALAGVAEATHRIRSGQTITLDGSAGTIRLGADSE